MEELNLYNRGVILAICSKNNQEEVLDVLRNHPDMVLRENHFANIKINWNDKVSNLKEIARELNLGLDSFVFVDDSEFEANMVKNYLPEVEVINLPSDPTAYRDLLNSCGFFDPLTFSEEDKARTQMYKDEAERNQKKTQFTNLEDYYRYLEMELDICSADDSSIARIAQLTQRTNQFNLTTKRYTESDIKDLSASEKNEVFYLRLKDRFGDAGIVGAAVLEYEDENALIDTFLLSCRVIGRGVEDAFLKECIERARKIGKKEIFGLYIKNKKNSLVADFYPKRNFVMDDQNGSRAKFRFSLDKSLFNFPDYFKVVRVRTK